MFAAKFRENAARSLLLPKRRPGMRAPLWQQRKRASDLLAVAARFGSFPVLLETYRECLRDFFDMPALVSTLADVRSGTIRTAIVDSEKPSPFAASLLFTYVASFIYDGDAPLAERRAQALSVDQTQLRELLGDAELRELLDADAIDAIEQQLQRLDPRYHVRSADGLHDLLLGLGDLRDDEIRARSISVDVAASIRSLVADRRAIAVRIAGDPRFIAVEDAARFRDALGVALPLGVPESLLEPVRDPLGDLARRYARTHAPFTSADFAGRYGLGPAAAEAVLVRLTSEGRLIEGEFRPGGTKREWTDANVLRMLRRRSLAKLRQEVEPVDQPVLGRFATTWQGIVKRRRGPDALLDVVEQLQGAPIAASILESDVPKTPSSNASARAARRSSLRSTTPPAAAILPKPSTRCGISRGAVWWRTTRSTRCARSSDRGRLAASRAAHRRRRFDRGAWRHRRRKGDGRSCRRSDRAT